MFERKKARCSTLLILATVALPLSRAQSSSDDHELVIVTGCSSEKELAAACGIYHRSKVGLLHTKNLSCPLQLEAIAPLVTLHHHSSFSLQTFNSSTPKLKKAGSFFERIAPSYDEEAQEISPPDGKTQYLYHNDHHTWTFTKKLENVAKNKGTIVGMEKQLDRDDATPIGEVYRFYRKPSAAGKDGWIVSETLSVAGVPLSAKALRGAAGALLAPPAAAAAAAREEVQGGAAAKQQPSSLTSSVRPRAVPQQQAMSPPELGSSFGSLRRRRGGPVGALSSALRMLSQERSSALIGSGAGFLVGALVTRFGGHLLMPRRSGRYGLDHHDKDDGEHYVYDMTENIFGGAYATPVDPPLPEDRLE